jgi:heme-degrading monooxygenase HmoA
MNANRYIIVFRSRLRPGVEADYAVRGAEIFALAEKMPGYLGIKDFTADDGERVAIAEFDTAEHLRAWREHPEHKAAQEEGRRRFYSEYSVQVCVLERESVFKL